jgi:hypothetical protein
MEIKMKRATKQWIQIRRSLSNGFMTWRMLKERYPEANKVISAGNCLFSKKYEFGIISDVIRKYNSRLTIHQIAYDRGCCSILVCEALSLNRVQLREFDLIYMNAYMIWDNQEATHPDKS